MHAINNDKSLDILKWDYYSYINKKRIGHRGTVRCYVSILTWMFERDSYESDPLIRHQLAFRQAVNKLTIHETPFDFDHDFDRVLKIWRDDGSTNPKRSCKSALVKPPVQKIKKWKRNGHSFVSLFSGAFGLDLGFMGAGFNPLVALDIDQYSKDTIGKNLPDVPFIHDDIKNIPTKKLLEIAGVDVGELDVVTGGPPCQPFATAGKRRGLNDPRASALKEFIRFIKEAQPKYFVMEEIEGLLNARLKHVPIADRGTRPLAPNEKTGSLFDVVCRMLRETGYHLTPATPLNAADFGAPQSRKRLIIIGSRVNKPTLPRRTHSYQPGDTDSGQLKPWTTFWEATCDFQGKDMQGTNLSSRSSDYLKFVPPGGNWIHLPNTIKKEAMGGAYNSGGGKMGYFRRLTWDTPTPTVTTNPAQKSTMLCHPDELRPMSVEEYKRVQGFPDDWDLPESNPIKYQLIGNAVPVYLSYAVANQVLSLLEG